MTPSLSNPAPALIKQSVARVLVVEDHQDIGDLMRVALSRSLIDATILTSGEEALQRLASETYDLILLDIALPGMNGLEVCRQIKASPRLKQIPVIFISGQVAEENQQAAKQLGAVDFIEKPFRLMPLLSCIIGHLKLKQSGQRDLRPLLPAPLP